MCVTASCSVWLSNTQVITYKQSKCASRDVLPLVDAGTRTPDKYGRMTPSIITPVINCKTPVINITSNKASTPIAIATPQSIIESQKTKMNDFGKIKQLPYSVWCIIICIAIGEANFETFSSQLIEPLMIVYNLTEFEANTMLSMASWFGIIGMPMYAYITAKYKICAKYFFVASFVSFVIAIVIQLIDLYWYGNYNDKKYGTQIKIHGWIAMIIESFGMQCWWPTGWALLFATCPKDCIRL